MKFGGLEIWKGFEKGLGPRDDRTFIYIHLTVNINNQYGLLFNSTDHLLYKRWEVSLLFHDIYQNI